MKQFIIFSKEDCEYCELAKGIFIEKGLDFVEFVIPDCEQILAFMKYSGLKTVPQVFVDGMLIGGYQSLESYFAQH